MWRGHGKCPLLQVIGGDQDLWPGSGPPGRQAAQGVGEQVRQKPVRVE